MDVKQNVTRINKIHRKQQLISYVKNLHRSIYLFLNFGFINF